jgi:hypothetical protein
MCQNDQAAPLDTARLSPQNLRTMRLAPALLLIAIAAGAWNHFSTRPVAHSAGEIAPAAPVQIDRSGLPSFAVGDYRITPAAEFSLEARTLSTEHYHLGREAELSPVDLALGWGPMSDSAVLDRLRISQGNRFYHYSWTDEPPIPPREIVEHSANMHMIPASDGVAKQLAHVRAGQIVQIKGYLVRVEARDGWRWNSSLMRSDSGSGACELVWVEHLSVLR